ncbi:MAG: hypothetical protein U1B81_03645 [Arthrobacter sp.]|nr:hypothetical protein [Arthrobacter sp.]
MKTMTSADEERQNPPHPGPGTGPVAGMPLGARRLVLIGGLCVPVGLVAGPYLLGLQLLAVGGVVAVAVALSYGPGRAWFWRWSWITAAAGALWMAATIAYWGTIVAAADASAPLSGWSPVLFNIGAGGLVLMAAATAGGALARYRSRRAAAAAA